MAAPRNARRNSQLVVVSLITGAAAAFWLLYTASPTTRSWAFDDEARGRTAEVPESIPARGLRDVWLRVYEEVSSDRVMLIAAGVAFHLLLAIFPALTALVSLYGLVADASTMADHLNVLVTLLPPGSFEIVSDEIGKLAATRDHTLGIAFLVSFILAIWSMRNGVLAIFDAMNVAYDENEKRGYSA